MPQYLSVISALAELPDRPSIVLLQPWSSFQIAHPRFLDPPSPAEATAAIRSALRRHGLDRALIDVVSHSYGTAIASWLIKAYPELIARSCFVDPIVFCGGEPCVTQIASR